MNIPNHVAIIMDGNGRWAEERGLKRSEGHRNGGLALEKIALCAKEMGIKYLSVYAFSTDNFKRSKEEVDYLMNLLIKYFKDKLLTICKEDIKVVFSGRYNPLRNDVINAMESIKNTTKDNKKCTLNICLNYGGQEEIVDATLKIHYDLNNNILKEEDLTRDTFYHYLYADLPPIDLLIRTGKEHRLSNFMLYQLFYAEIYFTDVYFPDFLETKFKEAITYYQNKDRRFGNVKSN